MPTEHLDVLIVGAGLSGIGAACRIQTECPGKTYAVLEAREASGGTWDLFRYPGIRSDTDMFTLGYPFNPWPEQQAIADGSMIREYVRATAREYGVDGAIRYRHRVLGASWSSEEARWTVRSSGSTAARRSADCGFLFGCTGYYRYDEGYLPRFEGTERFGGTIVHPQQWPEELDYAGKRVVVIGSGATAVTLVPAMADRAAHVTMLQRSPSYILPVPARDPSPSAAGSGCRRARVPARAVEERAHGHAPVQALPPRAAAGAGPAARLESGCRRGTTSTPTSGRATRPGTSACASSPTATSSRRSGAARPRSSPTASRRSPSAACGWRRAPSSRPT